MGRGSVGGGEGVGIVVGWGTEVQFVVADGAGTLLDTLYYLVGTQATNIDVWLAAGDGYGGRGQKSSVCCQVLNPTYIQEVGSTDSHKCDAAWTDAEILCL